MVQPWAHTSASLSSLRVLDAKDVDAYTGYMADDVETVFNGDVSPASSAASPRSSAASSLRHWSGPRT